MGGGTHREQAMVFGVCLGFIRREALLGRGGGEMALAACLLPPYAEVLTLEVRLALELTLALKCPAPRRDRGHGPGL